MTIRTPNLKKRKEKLGLNSLDNDLGSVFGTNFGSLQVYKGKREEKELVSWDLVPDCNRDSCTAWKSCTVGQNMGLTTERCSVRLNYLKTVEKIMFSPHNRGKMSEQQIMMFGFQVLPLYAQLINLKIFEAGYAGQIQVSIGKHGQRQIHPIYKEIRETIRVINLSWKMIGLDPISMKERSPFGGTGDNENGDPMYYDSLVGESDG
jgi:hypothetical protein